MYHFSAVTDHIQLYCAEHDAEQAQDIIDKCKQRLKDLTKRYKTSSETAQGKNDRLSLLGATDAESVRVWHEFGVVRTSSHFSPFCSVLMGLQYPLKPLVF